MKDRLLPLKQPVLHPFDPPLPLHVHVVRSIDHHLGHVGVLQQELDRTEPDDLVGNLVDHARQVSLREQRSAFPHEGQRFLAHTHSPLRSRRGGEPASIHPLPELRTQLTAHIGERIDAHRAANTSLIREPWSIRFLRTLVGKHAPQHEGVRGCRPTEGDFVVSNDGHPSAGVRHGAIPKPGGSVILSGDSPWVRRSTCRAGATDPGVNPTERSRHLIVVHGASITGISTMCIGEPSIALTS